MKVVKVLRTGNYTHHGIGYTEHDGYAGTADNRWSIKQAIAYEVRRLRHGETYRLNVDGIDKGVFTKGANE